MRRLLAAAFTCLPLFAAASTTPAATVAALWKASSHAPGVPADADRLQGLFRSDAVVAGGVYRDGQPLFQSMTAADFIAAQRQARPHGFHECEVVREVRQYDRFATVYSLVETRRDPKAAKAEYTGVNSIQLYRDEQGWKIVSLYYHVEQPGNPISLDGGKTGVCLGARRPCRYCVAWPISSPTIYPCGNMLPHPNLEEAMSDASVAPGLADKLMGPVSTIIDKKRDELMPMLSGGPGQAAQHGLRDDECVRKVATFCYPLLPGLLRLAVKEPAFVSFVMSNREKVLGRLAASV